MSCVIDLFITVYYFKTSFIFYLQAFNQSNTMGATSGAGTASPSWVPESNPVFLWDSCYSILNFLCNVLYIIVCPFVFFSYAHCIVCISAIYGFWSLKLFIGRTDYNEQYCNGRLLTSNCLSINMLQWLTAEETSAV
jgi:hypothetical protein